MLKIKNTATFIFIITFFLTAHQLKLNSQEEKNFLTLKSEIVNVRQGHSFDYPIKFIYRKKNLPVKIIDVWENFKKIQDYDNNQGWIHVSKLSKRKAAINIKNNSIIYKNSTIYSKPIARLELGRLVLIKKCKLEWCKIETGNFIGWMYKNALWGKI